MHLFFLNWLRVLLFIQWVFESANLTRLQVKSQQGRFWAPTTKERAFSGTSPLPITRRGKFLAHNSGSHWKVTERPESQTTRDRGKKTFRPGLTITNLTDPTQSFTPMYHSRQLVLDRKDCSIFPKWEKEAQCNMSCEQGAKNLLARLARNGFLCLGKASSSSAQPIQGAARFLSATSGLFM